MKCNHRWLSCKSDIFVEDTYPEVDYCPQCGNRVPGENYLRPGMAYNPEHTYVSFNPFTGDRVKTQGAEGMNLRESNLEFKINYTDISQMTLEQLGEYYHNSLFSPADLEIKGLEWFKWKWFDLKMKYL